MKKLLSLLLSFSLLIAAFAGCDQSPEDTGTSDTDTEDLVQPETESPASDFEYEVNETGSITITKYLGSDSHVVIPEQIDEIDVTEIGKKAFAYNTGIVSVEFPEAVTKIGERCFLYCYALCSVNIPPNVTTIALGTFEGCSALKKIHIPSNVKTIETVAFYECSQLSEVTLPDSLKKLGSDVFSKCISLKHISIPPSLTEWGYGVFFRSGLETIEFKSGSTLQIIPAAAFQETKIREIVLPSSIKEIHRHAFRGCSQLETIVLNDGLTNIGGWAFSNTESLQEISIPSSVQKMEKRVFSECPSLEKVKFEGNAPTVYFEEALSPHEVTNTNFTVYYRKGAKGFSSPEWNGYKTAVYE